jgi:hypothetical protein
MSMAAILDDMRMYRCGFSSFENKYAPVMSTVDMSIPVYVAMLASAVMCFVCTVGALLSLCSGCLCPPATYRALCRPSCFCFVIICAGRIVFLYFAGMSCACIGVNVPCSTSCFISAITASCAFVGVCAVAAYAVYPICSNCANMSLSINVSIKAMFVITVFFFVVRSAMRSDCRFGAGVGGMFGAGVGGGVSFDASMWGSGVFGACVGIDGV